MKSSKSSPCFVGNQKSGFLFNRNQPFCQDQWLNKHRNHLLENFKNKEDFHVNYPK